MNLLLSMFRRHGSAPVARDRLQVLLAHERAFVGKSDLLAVLQEEIIAVIAKHVTIERDKVQIKLDRGRYSFNAGDRRRGAWRRCGGGEAGTGECAPGDGGRLRRPGTPLPLCGRGRSAQRDGRGCSSRHSASGWTLTRVAGAPRPLPRSGRGVLVAISPLQATRPGTSTAACPAAPSFRLLPPAHR